MLRQDQVADTVLEFLRDTSGIFCMSNINSTDGYRIGCGHTFHLACLSHSMASLSRCVVCRYTIDRATYRVLGIDDVYPGIRQIDTETRAPLGSTTRQDLERVLRAEGHDIGAIDASFFEPVIAPWFPIEMFEALAHMDPHSRASTSTSTSSSRIFSQPHLHTL